MISKDRLKRLMLRSVREKKWRDERKNKYPEYLQSQEWLIKREEILKRDNYICRLCNYYSATQVHHLHYRNIFNERPSDLISICRSCHDQQHNKKEQ